MNAASARPVSILVAALGGQGGGVLAEWLVDAAAHAGYPAQSTSIPGVAQRTGATTYYIEIFPVPRRELGGREPVLSLVPAAGAIDLLVSSELLEAGRMAQAGFVDRERTTLVTSTSRTLTTVEKMALGDGRYASDRLLAVVGEHSAKLAAFDMEAVAREAGTVVSAVMFGAIAGSGVLPFGRVSCEAAIAATGVGAEASVRGFARGLERTESALAAGGTEASRHPATAKAMPPATFAAEIERYPAGCREIVAAGVARVVDYQDDAYARLYLDRVAVVRAAEETADPRGGHGAAVTRETARFLALWMTFDDIVRVADLKSRASRHARVRREAGAGEHDVLRVADYFKPGIPEMAGLLPEGMARRLVDWDRRRVTRGEKPFAMPMTVRADGIAGMLAMRVLGSLRGLRKRGMRYAEEQAAIVRWLDAIVDALPRDWSLAWELALAGRLVKGYGATNLRGKRNLAHILDHLRSADAIREAREAALADEGGRGLDAALVRHGAPARPPVAQPIRFMRRP